MTAILALVLDLDPYDAAAMMPRKAPRLDERQSRGILEVLRVFAEREATGAATAPDPAIHAAERLAQRADALSALRRFGADNRTIWGLARAGFESIEVVAATPDDELVGYRGIGPVGVRRLRAAIAAWEQGGGAA